MKSVIGTSVVIAALIGAAAVAQAETAGSARQGAAAYWHGHYGWQGVQRHGAMQQQQAAPRGEQAIPQAGTTGAAQAAQSPISDDQQAKIRATVKDNSEARVDHIDFGLRVGTAVPRTERLAALPEDAVAILPQFKGYKFLIDEEDRDIVIVDPRKSRVAAIIPDAETTSPVGGPSPTDEQGQTIAPDAPRGD